MGRRPLPPIRVRYTQAEALAALQLDKAEHLVAYAKGAGIELGRHDSLSAAQIERISVYLDKTMDNPAQARALASTEARLAVNPPVRRKGRLNPDALGGTRKSQVG